MPAINDVATVASSYKPRADDLFFPGMGLLILGIVVVGFGQSYFFAGMLRAKMPNAIVHIHGALFVSWIFLLHNLDSPHLI